ncbi:RNA polymerase sigma factor [Enhygromyxa salina]|uniref:ECF RNA polymerase sigma-E factor n=1 Tax=Enhygromyxa salina TaxID=215803 RepID=A0A2S9Y2J5_9BACT|nr:sigma-70 family RNA polymerase sigma factor [Enhygromyxa salina]PRP99324.1 ECF RNA polymerase sigma-E factor [Enhygromyxa salina]
MTTQDQDDGVCLEAWRAGDRAAGQRLFARYYEPVARFFINKVGDKSPDLIQRTFLACVEGMPRFRGEGSFRSYLFAVAYRQLCRHYRDQKGNRVDLDSVSAVALDPSLSGIVVEREEMRLFLAGLRDIPLELQVVLELHYWEDCSVTEIAVALDIPQGTVKSRLRRGREQLRATVERLAARPELAMSTLDGLETWAQQVRARSLRDDA